MEEGTALLDPNWLGNPLTFWLYDQLATGAGVSRSNLKL